MGNIFVKLCTYLQKNNTADIQGYYSFISAIHVVLSLPCLFAYLLIHLDKVDLYLGAVSGELISIEPSFFIIHSYLMFWVGYVC